MPQAEKMVYLRQQAEARRIPEAERAERSVALQLNEVDAVKGARISGLEEPVHSLMVEGPQSFRSKKSQMAGLRKFFSFLGRKVRYNQPVNPHLRAHGAKLLRAELEDRIIVSHEHQWNLHLLA